MLRGRWASAVMPVVIGGLLSTCVATVVAQSPKPVQNKPTKTVLPASPVEVPLDVSGDVPVVEVKINGAGPYRFLIDSGITGTVIDQSVVARAGLKVVRPVKFEDRSLIAADAADLVHLDALSLGAVTFEGFDAMAIDLGRQLGRARGMDGILGFNLFDESLVTIDYPMGRVRLWRGELPEADGREVLSYTVKDSLPHISVGVKDVSVEVGIDTTYTDALGVGHFHRGKIPVRLPALQEPLTTVISDAELLRPYVDGKLRIGHNTLLEVPARLVKDPSRLGHGVLKYFAVTFDRTNGRVRFHPRGHGTFSLAPESRFGIVFTRAGVDLKVVYIAPLSPADTGNIQVGDRVVSIERRSPIRFRDDELQLLLRTADSIGMKVDKGGAQLHMVLRVQPGR